MATHGGSQKHWEKIQANAQLISQAPDMLSALEMALAVIHRIAPADNAKEHIYAVISKAKAFEPGIELEDL